MDRDLEGVRAELRRLGYLSYGVERFLLQDALRPRARAASMLRLALRVALLAGLVLAPALALALGAANGNLESTPGDLPVLFLHVLLPAALAGGLGFLFLQGMLALALRSSRWGPETWARGMALGAGAAIAAAAVQRAGGLLTAGPFWQRGLLALAAALAVAFLVRILNDSLLATAILLTERAPRRPLGSRRWILWGLGAAVLALCIPALAPERGPANGPPSLLPTAPGERVVLVAVDGVLPQELEYLLAHGDLPAMAQLRSEGAALLSYQRPAAVPAAFWTSIATGLPSPHHGVAALDTLRPRGVATPLAQSGSLRAFFALEAAVGLAEYRPMLANRRSAYTFWELAARGGSPVLAVNWWATYPAEELPGLVVAHGAYQLLEAGAAGAVAPAAELDWVAARRAAVAREPAPLTVAAGMPPEAARELDQRAFAPDRFHRDVMAAATARSAAPRATALYLPGLDLAADGWTGNAVAWSDLVRGELRAADALLPALGDIGTLVLVFDPGRRGGLEGRVLLWRRGGCATAAQESTSSVEPEALASGLFAALGLPRSRELPVAPAICAWPEPPAVVASYGARNDAHAAAIPGEEYLRSLKALGYL